MTNDAQKYEKIFSGTKEVAENLKIDSVKLQPWIDAHVPEAGSIKSIEQFRGGQSNPTYKIITDNTIESFESNIDLDNDLVKSNNSFKNEEKPGSALCPVFAQVVISSLHMAFVQLQ